MSPWIVRHRLVEEGAVPFFRIRRLRDERAETLFRARIVADVEPVSAERAGERLHLRLRDSLFRLRYLREISRSDISREQADDRDHDQPAR